jgi:hypothetical protein
MTKWHSIMRSRSLPTTRVILGPDGKPDVDSNGNPLTSSSRGTNGWQGRGRWWRSEGWRSHHRADAKFAPAPPPSLTQRFLFGIDKSDPDYKNYLTGAKLPPGYFGQDGVLSFSANYTKKDTVKKAWRTIWLRLIMADTDVAENPANLRPLSCGQPITVVQ